MILDLIGPHVHVRSCCQKLNLTSAHQAQGRTLLRVTSGVLIYDLFKASESRSLNIISKNQNLNPVFTAWHLKRWLSSFDNLITCHVRIIINYEYAQDFYTGSGQDLVGNILLPCCLLSTSSLLQEIRLLLHDESENNRDFGGRSRRRRRRTPTPYPR